MEKFPDNFNPISIHQYKIDYYLPKFREKVYEHILKGNYNLHIDLNDFDREHFIRDIELVKELARKIIYEVKDKMKMNAEVAFKTCLFIYGEKKPILLQDCTEI